MMGGADGGMMGSSDAVHRGDVDGGVCAGGTTAGKLKKKKEILNMGPLGADEDIGLMDLYGIEPLQVQAAMLGKKRANLNSRCRSQVQLVEVLTLACRTLRQLLLSSLLKKRDWINGLEDVIRMTEGDKIPLRRTAGRAAMPHRRRRTRRRRQTPRHQQQTPTQWPVIHSIRHRRLSLRKYRRIQIPWARRWRPA